jgi:hypothetical protein
VLSQAAFRLLLYFFYNDDLPIGADLATVVDLLLAVDYFGMHSDRLKSLLLDRLKVLSFARIFVLFLVGRS